MLRRCAGVVLVAMSLTLALICTGASPAEAHPFGEPQQAAIAPTGSGLRVQWRAAEDDVAALAGFLGVLGGSHIVVYGNGEYDAEASSVPAGVQLAEAPEFADYVLAHVTATAAGATCEGTVELVEDVTIEGATVEFDCGGPVSAAEVTINTLIDVNEAYRTLASGPGGQRNVYSLDQDTFTWQLPEAGDPTASHEVVAAPAAGSALLQIGGIVTAVVLALLAWWGVARRRRSGRTDTNRSS